MAVVSKFYGQFLMHAMTKKVNLVSDPIKVMLVTNTYSIDPDNDEYIADVTGETTGTGYTAGGKTLTNKTVTYDAPTNTLILDGDDLAWTEATFTARYAVIYDDTATSGDKPLIAYVDFGIDVSAVDSTFQITWDIAGICTCTVV